MLLDILIPSILEMREPLMKFRMTQSSHSKQKLRVLFDLRVGKHNSWVLVEEKRSDTSRSRPENTTERKREPPLLVYRIIRDNVYRLILRGLEFANKQHLENLRRNCYAPIRCGSLCV